MFRAVSLPTMTGQTTLMTKVKENNAKASKSPNLKRLKKQTIMTIPSTKEASVYLEEMPSMEYVAISEGNAAEAIIQSSWQEYFVNKNIIAAASRIIKIALGMRRQHSWNQWLRFSLLRFLIKISESALFLAETVSKLHINHGKPIIYAVLEQKAILASTEDFFLKIKIPIFQITQQRIIRAASHSETALNMVPPVRMSADREKSMQLAVK